MERTALGARLLIVLGILVPRLALAQGGNWQTKSPMPTPASATSAGVIGGKLFVTGGGSMTAAYEPSTDTWMVKAPSTDRSYAASGVIDGKLFVAGGCAPGDCRLFVTNSFEVYDPSTDTWATKAPMPTARHVAGAATIDGKLYVAGGTPACPPCTPQYATLEVYDPLTDSWATNAPMPTSREAFGAAAIEGKLYVVGGFTRPSGTWLSGLDVYDPATNAWTTKAPMPTALADGLGVGVIDGKLHVVGTVASGCGPGIHCGGVHYVYDPVGNAWATETAAPTSRLALPTGDTVIDHKLYVAGGIACVPDGSSCSTTNALEVFTPSGATGASLAYSTYLGGTDTGGEACRAIATDALGNIYIVGQTDSPDFPSVNAAQPSMLGIEDGFVTKLSPDGSVVLFSTYLGGSSTYGRIAENATGVAVDSAGNVYVSGTTHSIDFPTTPGAFQTAPGFNNNGDNGFVTKFDSQGDIVYSTYIQNVSGALVAVDSAGHVYVTANSGVTGAPTTPGALDEVGPGGSWAGKLTPDGSALLYGTYLGIATAELQAPAIDQAGRLYTCGNTRSPSFPTTPGAFQTSLHGQRDAFVLSLAPDGSSFEYATYLGGSDAGFWDADQCGSVLVNALGEAYVIGTTFAPDFPTTAGAFQTSYAGSGDGFLVKLSADGTTLLFSTYLGGGGDDSLAGGALDPSGHVVAVGRSNFGFPMVNAVQASGAGGSSDAILAKVDAGGTGLLFSTYLGGTAFDILVGVAFDQTGNIVVAGSTASANFPTAGPALDASLTGPSDGVVAKFLLPGGVPPTADAGSPQAAHVGSLVQLDGTGSNDDQTASEDLLYAWTLASAPIGSAAALFNADTATPSFTVDVPGDYLVTLVVTDGDGLASEPSGVLVSSLNAPPDADAGPDQGGIVGDLVVLDGSGSFDPDFDGMMFAWSFDIRPAGSLAALGDAGTMAPYFTPDVAGTYVVRLTASDGFLESTDVVSAVVITAEDYAELQTMDVLNVVSVLPPDHVTTKGNHTALQNFLRQAVESLQAGNPSDAIQKLQQAVSRTDGCALRGSPDLGGGGGGTPPAKDYVTTCADQAQIYPLLIEALDALGAP